MNLKKQTMKYLNYIKYSLFTMSLILVGLSFTSCDDDITLDPVGDYDNVDGVYGSVKNVTGARELSTISVFGTNSAIGQIYFELTETTSSAVSVKLKIDEEALAAYNKANGTSYELYPAAQVAIANGGESSVASGTQKSEPVEIKISSNGGVGKTYALPISAEVSEAGITVSKKNQSYIYLVKVYPEIPDSDKGTGIKSILYVEVNDENILNAGEYTMAKSGKPFFDVVNIFAANINYNKETKRSYVHCNENVSHILKNADKFIRPLQAKGIKVCLTILGNHDEAGVANLSPEAAADFARELKSYVDVYGLDGVDFDDEYSKYNPSNPSPGFEAPSGAAAARLVYECRKIMPDKIISVYDYTNYLPTGTVEGEEIGPMIDYSYWGAYASWIDRHSTMTGMTKKQYGPSSFNLNFEASNGSYDYSHSERMRKEGYGIQMFYNLKTKFDYYHIFDKIGEILYDDNVEWSGITYAKNQEVSNFSKPSYDEYLGKWSIASNNSLYIYYDETGTPRWWDWSGSLTTSLTFEEKEAGKSYNVYGWYGTENDLPLVMNYNSENGRIEMPLPQKAIDTNTGKEWLYMGRTQYPYNSSYFLNPAEQYTAYIGVLADGNINMQTTVLNGFDKKQTRTMSAVQLNEAGDKVVAVKGSTEKDVVWQPFSMSK